MKLLETVLLFFFSWKVNGTLAGRNLSKTRCDYENYKIQHTLGFPWGSLTFLCFTISHNYLIMKNLAWIKGKRGKWWACLILYPISAAWEERSLVLWLYFLSWSQIWFTQKCVSIVQGVKEEPNHTPIWLYSVLRCHGGVKCCDTREWTLRLSCLL